MADSQYSITKSGELTKIYWAGSVRTYVKKNDGKRIVAYISRYDDAPGTIFYGKYYNIPLLMSTDPDAVTYTCSSSDFNTKTFTYYTTVVYKGLIWYVSPTDYGIEHSLVTSHTGSLVNLGLGTYTDLQTKLLSAANITVGGST